MDLSTKNRRRLLAGTVALILVIVVLTVLIYRADPANTQTENTPLAAETPAPVVTPAVTATAVAAASSSPAPAPLQAAAEVPAAASVDDTLPPISPEVAAEIRRLSIQNSEDLVEVKQPDGSTRMDLQGHFQTVTAAAIGADGKLVIRHGEEFLKNVK